SGANRRPAVCADDAAAGGAVDTTAWRGESDLEAWSWIPNSGGGVGARGPGAGQWAGGARRGTGGQAGGGSDRHRWTGVCAGGTGGADVEQASGPGDYAEG